MDHNLPLFKNSSSTRIKLIFFALLAIFLLIIDIRCKTLSLFVRETIATVIQPLQRIVLLPNNIYLSINNYFSSTIHLYKENFLLRKKNILLSFTASRAIECLQENKHLRALLRLQQKITVDTIAAQILYEAHNPYKKVVIINRGAFNSIQNGAPVVNEDGLVGQITRIYPFQSEVSLLTDKKFAVPIQNVRTGTRGLLYGISNGLLLEMRFVPLSVDILIGDELMTSGLDDVYPSGIPVAKIIYIDKKSDLTFAHVLAIPIAACESINNVLVLKYKKNK